MNWHCKTLCKKILRSFSESYKRQIYWITSTFTKTFPLSPMFKTKHYSSEATCFRPQVKPYNPKEQLVSWFRLRMERGRLRTAVFLLNTETMEKDLVNAGGIAKKKSLSKICASQLNKCTVSAQCGVSDCYRWCYIDTTIILRLNKVEFSFMTQGRRQNPIYRY